jgi:GDPmannose 4,6-dehydratase
VKALVCGISGQDGTYLAKLLLEKGYEVIGTSRDAMVTSFANLDLLGIRRKVRLTSMSVNDFRSVLSVIQHHGPDEIYNLAGQTSVGLSFEQPVEAIESITQGTLNILEAIRFLNRPMRFYSAGSSECFGNVEGAAADEATPFAPRSPYAVAKAAAHWLVRNYREAYGLWACTGILFNHESPLRPERFVTQKVVRAAARISRGSKEVLELGDLSIRRDWGWSPDYVHAMWRMLQQEHPDDFVIATGRAESLAYFVSEAFRFFGLEWQDHVMIRQDLFRPSDIRVSCGNPSRARGALDLSTEVDVDGVIRKMCEAALVTCRVSSGQELLGNGPYRHLG